MSFSGFVMCVQEDRPEIPGLLPRQDEPEQPPGSAPPTTESKQKADARKKEAGGTGEMRDAGRRALESGRPPRAGCWLSLHPSLAFLVCEVGMLLHIQAAVYVRCEDLKHCLSQEVLVIV